MKGWPRLVGFVLALLAGAVLRAGDSWTSGPLVAQIRVRCSPASLDKLRTSPREWVSCTVEVDDRTKVEARVRVKGAIGSFQPIDQSPSLTLDSTGGIDVFRGVPRVHLDNCAQDPGHLDAAFGAAAFRRVGVDSPRVQWALVRLNDRDLGWYVLKEGFTAGYAARSYGDVETVLGEPMSGGDVGGPLEFKAGGGETPRDRARELWSQLGALCRLGDPEARWRDLDRYVDRRGFLDFAAMEIVLAHRDGYSLARNNYRLVFARDRVHWMPWGMDQLLVSDEYTLEPEFSGELLRGIQRAGGFGAAWQDAVRRAAVALDREWCEAWIREVQDQVEQGLPFRHRAQLAEGVAVLRRRLDGRRGFVTRTLSAWAEPPRTWRDGILKPMTWTAADVPANGRAESVTNLAGLGGPALGLTAGPVTSSSWRATVRLEPGSYRFSGRVRTIGVEGLPFGSHHGVALRVLGEEGRSMELVGDNNWRELSVDFRVADQARDLSLICELRGRAGQVWFDRGSLQLLRLK